MRQSLKLIKSPLTQTLSFSRLMSWHTAKTTDTASIARIGIVRPPLLLGGLALIIDLRVTGGIRAYC